MYSAAADAAATKAPPPSPRDPRDELLLTDSTACITAPLARDGSTTASDTFTAQLPPLDLSRAIAVSQGGALPGELPQSRSQPSTTASRARSSSLAPPLPPPHKSSFSVPPSSRAHHTFSILDTDHSDALNARTANYETLLRQFALPRAANSVAAGRRRATVASGAARRMFRPPSVTAGAAYAAASAASTVDVTVAGASAAPTGRLHRTSSTEDLRHSLTRLGSSLRLDRIRRRSLEGSSRAPSVSRRDSDAWGSFRGLQGGRRVSVSRTLRRARLRVVRFVYRLAEPISPRGSASFVHQLVVLVLLLVQVAYTPFAASFLVPRRDDVATRRAMVNTNIALELAWLVDIALRLNTAVVTIASPTHPAQVVTSRTELAKRYLGSPAFVLDLISALPLETVFSWSSAHGSDPSRPVLALVDRHTALYHVGNALRLLKLWRAAPCLRLVQARVGLPVVSATPLAVLQTAAALAVVVHYLACAWHAALVAEHDPDPRPLANAYVHAVVEMSLLLVGDGSMATHALHEHSAADGHVLVARDLLVLGVVALGVVLSAVLCARLGVTLVLAALDSRETDAARPLQRALATLATRMDRLALPPTLQQRVAQYYTHVWDTYRELPAGSFHRLDGLSPPLALEVALSRYAATLGRLPLWKGCSADLLGAVLVAVAPRVYLRDDFVRRKGERASELLVLQRGACELMASSSAETPLVGSPTKVGVAGGSLPPERLAPGAALGQLALLVDYASPAYVRAVEPLEVAVLTREAFETLLHRFADDRTGLVRRVFRGALETRECAALVQLAGLSGSAAASETSVSTREAAKRLVRLLGIDLVPRDKRLRLPLALEAVVAGSVHQATLRRTNTMPERVPAHATPDKNEDAAPRTTTGTTARRPELDALAQTHETLLQLVTHLSDTAARLDAKLSRLEERAHRAEDAARFAAAASGHQASSVLLRRRSSQRSSIEPTAAAAMALPRRRSNLTSTTVSESAPDTERTFQAPRMLLPEEIAELEATAAVVVATTRSQASSYHNEGRDTLVSLPPSEDATYVDLRGVDVAAQRAVVRRAATRSPRSVAHGTTATRSRSLGVSTRQRLSLIHQAFTGSASGDPSAGPGAGRRPSLSAMWSRKPTAADG